MRPFFWFRHEINKRIHPNTRENWKLHFEKGVFSVQIDCIYVNKNIKQVYRYVSNFISSFVVIVAFTSSTCSKIELNSFLLLLLFLVRFLYNALLRQENSVLASMLHWKQYWILLNEIFESFVHIYPFCFSHAPFVFCCYSLCAFFKLLQLIRRIDIAM